VRFLKYSLDCASRDILQEANCASCDASTRKFISLDYASRDV